MLVLLDLEDYDECYVNWNMVDLFIVYIFWCKKLFGDVGVKVQFKIIFSLLKQVKSVVYVGDLDDEGQFLVDEILEYVNCCLLVQWLFINDNNVKIVCWQFVVMCDNCEFVGLFVVVEVCSVGDQLYGFNIMCLYMFVVCVKGYQGLLSVGCVQILILGFVVCCCCENVVYQKIYYYLVNGQFEVEGIQFLVCYQVVDGDLVDEKGCFSNKEYVEGIVVVVSG